MSTGAVSESPHAGDGAAHVTATSTRDKADQSRPAAPVSLITATLDELVTAATAHGRANVDLDEMLAEPDDARAWRSRWLAKAKEFTAAGNRLREARIAHVQTVLRALREAWS